MREIIRNALLENAVIKDLVDEANFYTYRVPEQSAMQRDIIIYIDMLDVPMPYLYYDGEAHTEEHLTQIAVFAPAASYNDWLKVNAAIRDVMLNRFRWKVRGGVDEFDDEYKVFHYAQRFEGTYKKGVDKLWQ